MSLEHINERVVSMGGARFSLSGFQYSCEPREGDPEGCDTSACVGTKEVGDGLVAFADVENGVVREYPTGPAVFVIGALAAAHFRQAARNGEFNI